jgi:hypothetical protein
MNVVTGKLYTWKSLFGRLAFLMVVSIVSTGANGQIAPSGALPNPKLQDRPFHRSWQFGGFFTGGFAPFYEIHTQDHHFSEELNFFSAGLEGGRMLTAPHGPHLLHGRGEAVVEVLPFWVARIPRQDITIYDHVNEYPTPSTIGPLSYHGASVTPLLFRWNFMKQSSSRFVPWVQAGSGLLWTTNNFPQALHTSRINFTPQVDFGANVFTRNNQSMNLAMKVVHISSAGLGNYNPGVNVTLQFSVGYSWWK